MNEQMKDGGPAFPVPDAEQATGFPTEAPGMSLRDWFAGQALAGNLSSQSVEVGYYDGEDMWRKAAKDAYKAADAMIAQREKGAE